MPLVLALVITIHLAAVLFSTKHEDQFYGMRDGIFVPEWILFRGIIFVLGIYMYILGIGI